MEIKKVKISDLKHADYNPRQMTEKQVEDLKQSIQKFGLVEPILVNSNPDRANTIIGGHQRAKIAAMLGFGEVNVIYLDLTIEQERELNIRLNKNTGEWSWDDLANNFSIDELKLWGFDEGELIGHVDKSIFNPTEFDDKMKLDEKKKIECPSCHHVFEA